jgi:hypothetical protein
MQLVDDDVEPRCALTPGGALSQRAIGNLTQCAVFSPDSLLHDVQQHGSYAAVGVVDQDDALDSILLGHFVSPFPNRGPEVWKGFARLASSIALTIQLNA